MGKNFLINWMHANKKPDDFGLTTGAEKDEWIRAGDNTVWKYSLFDVEFFECSGYYRIPLPCFDDLVDIVMLSDDRDDRYGAAATLLDDDHADQLLEKCLEMLDSDDPEQYYDFFQTLQLGKPENRSPTAGKNMFR